MALLSLVYLAGCASELAFVKGNSIHKIKDDGDDLTPVSMPAGRYYFRPDVSNDGRDLVFVSAPPTAPGIQVGVICRSKLDGSGFTMLNPSGPPQHDPPVVARRAVHRVLRGRGCRPRHLPDDGRRHESHNDPEHGGFLRRRP